PSGVGNCAVQLSGGNTCLSGTMHVCVGTTANASDPEGNTCNWAGCGWNADVTTNEYYGGCGTTAGAVCCPINGCSATAVDTQYFYEGMVGCAGSTTYPNRASLCKAGWVPCKPEQWMARRG